MRKRSVLAVLVAFAAGGCAAIAGFEDDYSVGTVGTGTAATGTGTAGTATGTAGASTGTAGTATGTAGTSTAAGGEGGARTGAVGGNGTGGSPLGGGGQGATDPTWVEIDAFEVPIDGTTVQSTVTLAASTTYRLRVSGIFDCLGTGAECDAEYVDRSGTPDDFGGGTYDFGVGIDATAVSAAVAPFWGPPSPTHVYEVDWPGADSLISAKLWDPNYGNNSGSPLHLQIFEFK